MSDYNGWTNRETWLVNVHFNPESVEDIERIKDHLEEYEDEIENAFIRDFIDFSKINWRELKEVFNKEVEQ